MKSKLKIKSTAFPNGTVVNWCKINTDKIFGYDKWDNKWFFLG